MVMRHATTAPVRTRTGRTRANRAQLLREVDLQWRELSLAMVLFQTRAADHFGLTMSDLKAIDVLSHAGPLSAGELAARCGLTPGAVTGLLNRLERAKVVQRVTDSREARRMVIRIVGEPRHGRLGDRVVKSLKQALKALTASFSEDELAAIVAFLTRSARTLREEAEAIP
jgi:DNA-binding MarR family transcriptional regulator